MEIHVIENALDFIMRAADDFWSENLTEAQQLKYSTIELYEGIELLLKARLMQEHWSLILRNIDQYKKDCFNKGDFVSVNYDTTKDRLLTICNVELDPRANKAFNDLRELRNRYVHFVCNESRETVAGIQIRAWHHILWLLEDEFLGSLNGQQREQIDRVRQKMMRSEEFLNMRYEEVKPEIESQRKEGLLFANCFVCGKNSLRIGDGYPKCLVCSIEMYFQDAAEAYAKANDPWWSHPKHGVDDVVAWCEYCGEQAVVPVRDDLAEEAAKKLPNISREPGEDWEIYICLACGEPAIDWWIKDCGYCGEKYCDSGGKRICPACGQ